jgi:hypothetical protein
MSKKYCSLFPISSNLIFSEMIEDFQKDSCKAQCQKELVSMKFDFLTLKLENAKKLKSQIGELTLKENFMTDNQVKEEEMKTKEKLEDPLKIIANIEEFENDSEYLNYNNIQILRGKIESVKSSLRKNDESDSHLECVICLSVPKCQKGSVFIYSCDQDHLLCRDCIQRVDSCPSKFSIQEFFQ